MPALALLIPVRRDALLAVVALGLLAAPLWVPALHISDPSSRYERTAVTTNGTGLEYADRSAVPPRTPISEDIACSGALNVRSCAFERLLLGNRTIPTDVYTTNPDSDLGPWGVDEPYRYVLLNGTVYEPVYDANRSAKRDEGRTRYRLEMDLEPVPPERALEDVSVRVGSSDVPSVAAEAAKSGEVRSRAEVDVPETPIRVEEGTYYRVYRADSRQAPPMAHVLDFSLTFGAPFVGLYLLLVLSRRIEVTHVEDRSRR